MVGRNKHEKSFDDLRSNQTRTAEREGAERVANRMSRRQGESCVDAEADEDISRSNQEGSGKKRKTLQELHKNPPPGFRKFESEVDWRTIDEEIALQLWEDVFKPLYTFY